MTFYKNSLTLVLTIFSVSACDSGGGSPSTLNTQLDTPAAQGAPTDPVPSPSATPSPNPSNVTGCPANLIDLGIHDGPNPGDDEHCIEDKRLTRRARYTDAWNDCAARGLQLCSAIDLLAGCHAGLTVDYLQLWGNGNTAPEHLTPTAQAPTLIGSTCTITNFAVFTRYSNNYAALDYVCCNR